MVTIDEFAKITRRIIARDGFDEYLPTALYPGRNHVVVLKGIPAGCDVEPIAVGWAANGAIGGEEFLVAFKVSSTAFKVIRRYPGGEEERVFDAVEIDA
jgi:hypothetical protein